VLPKGLLGAALAAALLAGAPVQAVAKHDSTTKVEGRILSVNKRAHTFRVRDRELGVAVSIRVTKDTKFDHLSGFPALHAGRHVEAKVLMVRGRLVATRIDRPSN
jgi:hypothetical protein